MKKILIVVSLVCLSVLSSFAQDGFSTFYYQRKTLFEKLPNHKKEIVFVGNSITNGCEWAELFQNHRIVNRGISGDTTDGVLYRLNEITESHPQKVFLLIGINDLSHGKSKEYVESNIQKIVNKIHKASPKTHIFVQSIFPVNDHYKKFSGHTNKGEEIIWINKQLKKKESSQYYTFIDVYSSLRNNENKMNLKYSNDGLHLLGEGYLQWKEVITPYI